MSPGCTGFNVFVAMIPILVPMLGSMVVDNLDVGRISVFPSEGDARLLRDPDAVLTLAVALERFELIRRWDS